MAKPVTSLVKLELAVFQIRIADVGLILFEIEAEGEIVPAFVPIQAPHEDRRYSGMNLASIEIHRG